MKLREPNIYTDGPWAEHDQACAVCRTRHAVIDVGTGRFQPCWSCQADGWKLTRRFSCSRLFNRSQESGEAG